MITKVIYDCYKNLGDDISAQGLKRFLGKKGGNEIFPNDNRVKTGFIERDIYKNPVCKLILLEIEKLSNAEPPREDTLTIEHFYPQTATKEWRDMVGDWEDLEADYLNTFGNLTLTGQNARLGNKSFKQKLELILDKGSLRLNDYFTNVSSWGVDEIIKRAKILADKFCQIEIFRDLPQEYRQRSSFKTLDENFTHYRFTIIRFPNRDEKYVNNAKGLVKVVIEYLCANHKDMFEEYVGGYEPSCIVWSESKAKSRDKQGSIVMDFRLGFYYISSASFSEVGKNLSELVRGCGLNPKDFILE